MVPLSTHTGGPPPLHPAFAGGNPCGGTTLGSAPLVARNSSWGDFRRSGSQEDHSRFRFLRQQFHSTVRSSRARFWSEWLHSVQSLSHRDPRLASSLIRRTFRTPTAPPNLCNMNWGGVRSSALSPHDAGTHWRAHFASSSSHSLSVSRHSRLHTSRANLTHFSLTTSLLLHCPGATSLRRARTASRTPLSKFPLPGGVTCSSRSSTSSCGSPSSLPLGSPVWSSQSSSVTVTPLSSTLIVPYLSPLVLSKSSSTWSTLALHHTFHHSWMCRKVVSVGRRHSCLQPCRLPASPPSDPHFCRFH